MEVALSQTEEREEMLCSYFGFSIGVWCFLGKEPLTSGTVFQMNAVQNHIYWLLLLLLWPLCVLGKCIFDEVQSSVRTVSSPVTPLSSFDWSSTDGWTHVRRRQHATSQSPSRRSKRMVSNQTKAIGQPQAIRIRTWTPRENPTISHWERERVESAVNEAVSTVSNLLSVMRVPGRLLLNRDINKYCRFIWRNSSAANYNRCGRANENYRSESCLGVTIPDDHLSGYAVYLHPEQPNLRELKPDGPGVPDTDFLLYVHTVNTDKCRADSRVLAYSAHCQTDAEGRPVAGVMVICRESMGMKDFRHEHVVQTVIHELFHMLGFSRDLFSTWRDLPLTSKSLGRSLHGHLTNTDETGQMRLYSPSVMKALQKHLNSTLAELGAALENQDAGVGSVSSHWEARVLQGSIMVAALGESSLVRIDLVTLSALQDTGWYSVNVTHAQSLIWGEGEGSLFGSISTCNKSSSFFCMGSGLGCHYLHLHKGECQSDEYLEGCSIYKPLANASECWKEENDGGSEAEEWSGEIYQSDSRCFFSSLVKEDHASLRVSMAGRCYRHRCTGRNMYQIQVEDSDWLDCPAGKSIEVAGYQGRVFCPDKRLCYYHDVVPPVSTSKSPLSVQLSTASSPSERNHTHSQPPMASQSSLNLDSALHVSMPASRTVIIVLPVSAITVVLSCLAVLLLISRKCCSASVRVHALIDASQVLQLQAA